MAELSTDDIRASVAAGVIDESQAASVLAVAQDRRGYRSHMSDEDEPFELFRGFSEIFVTVGLALLSSGLIGLSLALGNPLAVPFVSIVISVLFAVYFTRRRRMTLPSIFLATTFGGAVLMTFALFVPSFFAEGSAVPGLIVPVLTAVALLVYFRSFLVPFTMFLVGLCGIAAAYGAAGLVVPGVFTGSLRAFGQNYLDLGGSPVLALTLLVFGLLTFGAAMSFDLRDPFRVSRHAASGFWLHILAAPAIVNVVSASLIGIGGAGGYLLAAGALCLVALVALIIDRRSFLTAGIIYFGVILGWTISSANIGENWKFIWILLIMGAFITTLGAFWVSMRGAVMRSLPDFPGKTRLPPYQEQS
ncbi:MAG: hypothetical protein ACE5DK_06345 [Paracoccaceae bacterium]